MKKAKVPLISIMMAFVLKFETAKTSPPAIAEPPTTTAQPAISEEPVTKELSPIETSDPDEIIDTISM